MATHSSILAWKIPWTEESGGRQSLGSQNKSGVTEHIDIHTNTHFHQRTGMNINLEGYLYKSYWDKKAS